mmetsp:Transcript_27683/g.51938  ORF Transcript_27683/g.51938 Transcript_27683/m.51938 type:complete len:400 (-) Transcript_27683:881-2080(-)
MVSASSTSSPFVYDDLAFTSPRPAGNTDEFVEPLVTAVARAPFLYGEETTRTAITTSTSPSLCDFQSRTSSSASGITLNVELFGDASWNRILCFVPGVCESVETWTAQNLARKCQDCQWRLAVLELEGHGLSSGGSRSSSSGTTSALMSGGMDQWVDQVIAFCRHVLALQQQEQHSSSLTTTTLTLSGSSLGGCLAAYASQKIAEAISSSDPTVSKNDDWKHCNFVGAFLLSPAVGINAAAVPPPSILTCLSVLAKVIPSVGFLTPVEDPSHYNCPPWTKRNFAGSWPLKTSKQMLDITQRVPKDVREGTLNMRNVPFVTVISGSKDPIVPLEAVKTFVEAILEHRPSSNESNEQSAPAVEFIPIAKGDHGLLATPLASNKKTAKETIEQVVKFLQAHS